MGSWETQRPLQGLQQVSWSRRIQKMPLDCFRKERKYSKSQPSRKALFCQAAAMLGVCASRAEEAGRAAALVPQSPVF